MSKVNILGVNLSNLSRNAVERKIDDYLKVNQQKLIVTPNAEFILAAQHDEEFFYILNHADLAVLDGSGPQLAARLIGHNIERYPGADLVQYVLGLASEQRLKVLILNWQHGLSSEHDLRLMLQTKYPGAIAKVMDCSRTEKKLDVTMINDFKPQIILSTLGAPFQEKMLYHLRGGVPSLSLVMGIGGALDFLTGKIARAPQVMRLIGVEWLWRLYKQPQRLGRIWNAVAVFLYKFIKWQFILPYLYRPNVACFLYKKSPSGHVVLMVERADMSGHWQLPQGGTDGESIERAGRRELFEELGVTQFETRRVYKNVFRYNFHKQRRAEVQRHLGYKGQKQSLYVAEYLGSDEHFAINFWDHTAWRWVPVDRLLTQTYEIRRDGYQKFLDKFNEYIKES
ncbi:MAG: WecB/TagA/CpsF family glycosyltransferase [bacterium]